MRYEVIQRCEGTTKKMAAFALFHHATDYVDDRQKKYREFYARGECPVVSIVIDRETGKDVYTVGDTERRRG